MTKNNAFKMFKESLSSSPFHETNEEGKNCFLSIIINRKGEESKK